MIFRKFYVKKYKIFVLSYLAIVNEPTFAGRSCFQGVAVFTDFRAGKRLKPLFQKAFALFAIFL
jgi:hypothetical protein